jgi:hypothetical protein
MQRYAQFRGRIVLALLLAAAAVIGILCALAP